MGWRGRGRDSKGGTKRCVGSKLFLDSVWTTADCRLEGWDKAMSVWESNPSWTNAEPEGPLVRDGPASCRQCPSLTFGPHLLYTLSRSQRSSAFVCDGDVMRFTCQSHRLSTLFLDTVEISEVQFFFPVCDGDVMRVTC